MRYAHGVHASCRDVPIHLGVARVVTLDSDPDRSARARGRWACSLLAAELKDTQQGLCYAFRIACGPGFSLVCCQFMETQPNSRPRVALIGVSGYGQAHYNHLVAAAQKGSVEVLGATVINQAQEIEKCAVLRGFGGRIYATAEEMLADMHGRLDLCLIPTGIAWHEPMTIAALEAGANVLVEKPLTGSVASADRMLTADHKAKGAAAVGFQDVYHPSVRRLQEMLAHGELGRIREIRFGGAWPRGLSYYGRNNWAGKLQVDGIPVRDSPLNNAFAHLLNLSLFLAGAEPGGVAGVDHLEADLWRANEIETFDTVALRATLVGGARLLGWLTHACEETVAPVLHMEAEAGSVVWEYEGEGITIERPGKEPLLLGTRRNPTTREAMFDQVFSWPVGEPAPCCPLSMAATHVRVIERLHAENTIHEIPSSHILRLHQETDERRVISDFSRHLQLAMEKKCFFSELGHPAFARAATMP
jgi:predicted dehydrogenase